MGDSGSDDEDTSWESKWTEKQEKYKAYAVSKLQKHLAEIQEDIDKYDVKLEKLRKKGAPRSATTAPRRALLTRRLAAAPRAEKKGEKDEKKGKEVKDSHKLDGAPRTAAAAPCRASLSLFLRAACAARRKGDRQEAEVPAQAGEARHREEVHRRAHPEEEGRRRRRHDGGGEEGEGARRAAGAERPRLSREQRAYVRTSQKIARTQRAASIRRAPRS